MAKWDAGAWTPKSVQFLSKYKTATFSADLVAGLTVGLVALPLAMAFAISSGMPPQAGIYTAVVAGLITSLFGGTRTQISGPTGAFVVVVAGIVARHGVNGLFMCTLMAGVMLVLLGVTGLGTAVKFIPRPVVVGFTNGIALLIASTQIKDFFGIHVAKVPSEFMPRLAVLSDNFGSSSPQATGLSIAILIIIILLVRLAPRVPSTIVALFLGTLLCVTLKLPIETIQTRFGGIPHGLPAVHFPEFKPALMGPLMSSALTVAMLGAIESLMSAVVADRMTQDKHNPNVELIGQGLANIASPLVGGLPATGAIARTATNIKSGAKTPIAGVIHSVVLLAVLLFAAPLAGYIPLSVLAAILIVVAYNMGEWKEIPQIVRLSKADVAVWFVTFMLTVFADLTVAVQAGMILAALLYITRVTSTTTVQRVDEGYLAEGHEHILQFKEIPHGVTIFRIHGPFLFGSTDKIDEIRDQLSELPPVVIMRLRNMTAIDTTGIQALEELAHSITSSGRHILFCGMRDQPMRFMERAGFDTYVGRENICPSVNRALDRARELLGQERLDLKP